MAAYKDKERNTWYVAFYYRDWQGNNKKKKKRGFKTKREALDWEQSFRQKQAASLDMLFKDFVEVYAEDMKPRLKYNTWLTKEHIIKTKLIPYFGSKNLLTKVKYFEVSFKIISSIYFGVQQKGRHYIPAYINS